ncbi:MAG: hypothetical protein AUF60_02745 [Gemmatimonadetes bacterium 13_1_20CM_69_28]|nr:MAG: hypothetical protein AUF60_02745 [Gemmatimonadetes bacterium 13_1_20CM_69_28]
MKPLSLFRVGGLLATMAGLAGGCHLDKLLQAPSGEGPTPQTRPQLVFTGQPGDVPAGQPIAPAVRVTVQDSTGQPDGNFNGPVTVALAANPVGATLSGGLDVNAVSGVATFSDLKVNKVGRGYTLRATTSGATGATSDPFDITTTPPPPQATQLVYTVQPTRTSAGATITPAVEVTAVDDQGRVATSFSGFVTVAIGHDASLFGNAVLSGTRTVRAVNGVARFGDLSIDQSGNGYTLQAAASTLRGAESSAFNISVL